MTTSYPPLYGPAYPDALDDQIRALDADDALRAFADARSRLAADPYRPAFHFSPPQNVMNDPNGLCFWQGRWHLFFQFRPGGEDDRVHWGHTVSDDLAHWRDLPIALYPDTEKDCYSGQALVEDDRVIAIYHGTESGNAIATASDPLLLNWRKHPNNPIIPIVPIDDDGSPYRVFDPCIWKQDDGYYYALSGTYKNGERGVDCQGIDHLFRSRDLAEWEHIGALLEDKLYAERGEDQAVPVFWHLSDKDGKPSGKHMLLLFSHKRSGRCYVGDYDPVAHDFTPDFHQRMNYGSYTIGALHAPSAAIGPDGRFTAIFNVKEGKPAAGWDNIMSLPRHYWLADDGTLGMAVAGNMESLRGEHKQVAPMDIPANDEVVLDGIGGKTVEIQAVIEPGDAREVGLYVLRSPDGKERTRVSLYPQDHRRFDTSSLQIDISEGSQSADVFARTPEAGPIKLAPDEPLRLRVFVDRSIVEVFANDKQCLTLRTYPQRDDSSSVSVFARGSGARLAAFDIWQIASIWE
ncbi:MAG: glycoside hydrolase family 32 protein [Chloroflexi bacterium]|nr:glycoside hydrolase family 32 protein [Chloroflexota bacterium]